MPSPRVGRRGQITVPEAGRESLRDLRGSVPADGPQDVNAVRDAVRAGRADRLTSPEANPDPD